jgi:hypothetical protein
MTRPKLLGAILLATLTCATYAQERGAWRASNNSAKSITGDVSFGDNKFSLNFDTFPAAQIRTLTPAEIGAAFDADTTAGGVGNLFRISIPAARHIVGKNSLCGGEDTQWMATYVLGRTLQIAMFSGPAMPVLTPEAMTNNTNLCGVYTYTR